MPCRIPETEADGLAVDHDICRVVVKTSIQPRRQLVLVAADSCCAETEYSHRGDVFTREGVGCVRDEETCLFFVSGCVSIMAMAGGGDSLYQQLRRRSRHTAAPLASHLTTSSGSVHDGRWRRRTFRDWVAGAAIARKLDASLGGELAAVAGTVDGGEYWTVAGSEKKRLYVWCSLSDVGCQCLHT